MATIDNIRNILKDVLQLGHRADGLNASTSLFGSIPEFDSVAVVTVLTALEDRFGILIEDDDISARVATGRKRPKADIPQIAVL